MPGTRDDVVAAYRPALALDGDAARGRDHFVRACAGCHRLGDTGLTIRRGGAAIETVARGDVEAVTSTGRSLMPEGLEQELDRQAFADLLAYLKSAP